MKTLGLLLLSVIALGVVTIAREMLPQNVPEDFKQPPGFRR